MADPWGSLPVVEDEDPWADLVDAPDEHTIQLPKFRTDKIKVVSTGLPIPEEIRPLVLNKPIATDGDTVRDGAARIRMLGIDAPELSQQGWDRLGNPVPIGEQSRDFLANTLGKGPATAGPSVGRSYGRRVAPITVGTDDAGLASIRYGQGLAAPEYLVEDPARRSAYVQAERLARLNGLGQHDYFVPQSPKEFRDDGQYVPERETVAQFFDTPTPLQGMRPEQEAEYLRLLNGTGTADEVLAYVRGLGFDMREDEVRKSVAWRDEERAAGREPDWGVRYERGPRLEIDGGGGALGATVRGAGGGLLAGGADEVGAFVDMLGGTPGRENIWNSDRRWADVWANNQYQNAATLDYDQNHHPIASTVGEVAGALASGLVIPWGAGARTVPQLAKVGATYGGAEGFLGTDGTTVDRAKGAVIGAPIGAAFNSAAGKALEYGAPIVARGLRFVTRRNADKSARAAGEVAEGYGSGEALEAGLKAAGDVPPRPGADAPQTPRFDPEAVSRAQADWPETVRAMEAGETDLVEGAIYHPELGHVDMRWGEPGDPAREFKGGFGLSHIIAKHGQEGIVPDLPERIAGMRIVEGGPHPERVQLEGPGGRAAVATTWHGDEQRWVVTAFDPDWRPPPEKTSTPVSVDAGSDSSLRGDGPDIGSTGLSRNEADQWAELPDAEPEPSLSADPLDDPQIRSLIEAGAGEATIRTALKAKGLPMPPLGSVKNARRVLDPATAAERAAAAERVQPGDMLPMPRNYVDGPEEAAAIDAGRFGEARAVNERRALERRLVTNWRGEGIPKVGPLDMVGWLRSKGGLRPDEGGELAMMGLNNAARRGMDFVGSETRFGPLVDPDGMDLDDAALLAWEAGYFPEHLDRPDVITFLDALRDTYDGNSGRRFVLDDQPEIEAYQAMQGERVDLEQQRHDEGAPIWQDRSGAGDDAAPFAPPEAYEEWPSDAIQRVGNIDVSKLDSPQDIARALKSTHNAVGGFDAATRGRITQAETERLAAELNMTPEGLLSRRKGQAFNAEEALAARQMLAKSGNELVNAAKRVRDLGDNPGSEALAEFRHKWMRHVAIQEQVSGMTAEAGRALQQFRQLADSREVRADVLSSMVMGGGGPKRLQEAADTLLDAVEVDPGVFNTIAEKTAQPRWQDKVAEWYINALLGRPSTHIVNITSNTLTSIAQIPEFALGSVIGGGRQALTREAIDRITATEVGARAFGLLQGAKEGARLFAQALRTGEGSDFGSKVENQAFKAIGGKLGEVVRIPTRFLTAEDELFKGVARRMELNGQAVRIARKEGLKGDDAKRRIAELVADPTDEMFQQALDYGRYLTFQQKLGPRAQKVSAFVNETLPLKFIMPFIRTPTNLLKFATERSPAAPLLSEWRKDFLAGGARRDMAVAKMMVGTGFGLALHQAAAEGFVTGSAPKDRAKSRLLYADGWKPYSVKIDGTYYSYKRLDPFSTTIGVAADMATLPEGMTEKQREDKGTLLVASLMGNLASKTWASGVSDLVLAWSQPERYAGDFKNRLIASFLIPNVVRGAASDLDPVARKTDGLAEEMRSRIPGLKDDLLPKRDVWGRPIVSEGGLGPDFVSPIWLSTQLNDPVNHELMQLDYAPGVPNKKVGGRELSPVEYDRYLEAAGQGSHAALSKLVASPEWRALDDEGKVSAARKEVAAARKAARDTLFTKGDAVNDPWSELPSSPATGAVDDPWSELPSANSRDVVADLQAAIPGVRFTSGYRSDAYNQSLKSRGYHPADNSEHLDGSSLDLLPPPGKTLQWLMARTKEYDPKARLLIHDGHLHAAFNGYYGAPVLGGAKTFGDRNPNLRGR